MWFVGGLVDGHSSTWKKRSWIPNTHFSLSSSPPFTQCHVFFRFSDLECIWGHFKFVVDEFLTFRSICIIDPWILHWDPFASFQNLHPVQTDLLQFFDIVIFISSITSVACAELQHSQISCGRTQVISYLGSALLHIYKWWFSFLFSLCSHIFFNNLLLLFISMSNLI
jgi:hypothetical protein